MDPIPPQSSDAGKTAGHKFLWMLLAVLAIAPASWQLGLFLFFRGGDHGFWSRLSASLLFAPTIVLAIAMTMGVVWLGLRQGWYRHRGQLWLWGLAAGASITYLVLGPGNLRPAPRDAQVKTVLGNLWQIKAALDQYSLEFSERIFFTYDDFIGPLEYVKELRPVVGEDYHSLFPMLRNLTDPLSVKLPDGRVEQRSGILAVTLPDGTRVSYPNGLNVKDSPQPDGVHVFALFDRSRLEITYRGGVPDGPFRAYHADGTLWGEATYEHGHITGPCWVYLRDGTKFNENTPGTRRADHLGLK